MAEDEHSANFRKLQEYLDLIERGMRLGRLSIPPASGDKYRAFSFYNSQHHWIEYGYCESNPEVKSAFGDPTAVIIGKIPLPYSLIETAMVNFD